MKQNLYYNKNTDLYYFTDVNKECDNCFNIIEDIIYIRVHWDKLGSGIKYFCFNCQNKQPIHATVIENRIAVVTEDIPKDSVPNFFNKPILNNATNLTNFDVALKNLGSETIKDKTVYAGRETWEGTQIGAPDIIAQLEKKDNAINSIEDDFKIFNAVPLIEQQDKKQLTKNDEVKQNEDSI